MSEPFVARQRIALVVAAQLVPMGLALLLWVRRPELQVAPSVSGYLAALWALQLGGLTLAALFIEREETFKLAVGTVVFFAGVPLNGLLIYAFTAR